MALAKVTGCDYPRAQRDRLPLKLAYSGRPVALRQSASDDFGRFLSCDVHSQFERQATSRYIGSAYHVTRLRRNRWEAAR